jgi:transcriptional regulator with PAS, ATPase and Fis domain
MLEEELKDLLIQPVFTRGTVHSTGDLHREWARYGVITRNPLMVELFAKVQRAAATRHPVLILGETGTGKDLVAQAIHRMSDRSHGPFVTVNVPAIQENLIESELFGHLKGAFTGAIGDKLGKFQTAAGGTIFLDEIGEMRSELQAKLLRVVQAGEVDRVGGLRPEKIDVRIVAATNRDVHAMVERGAFRADLYYRLKVMMVVLPPLRERPEDVDVLAEYFLDRYALESDKSMKGITVKAMARLRAHAWRGNVRELEHTIARAVALAAGDRVTESDLELTEDGVVSPPEGDDLDPFGMDESLSDGEFIARLRSNQFEIGKTAEQLRVSRGTVGLRLKGICFRLLAESGGDREKAAALLCGGDASADVVRSRIDEYYTNLVDVLHEFETAEQALEACRRRWKNLPQKYFKGLDVLIHRYFEQLAAKR